MRDILFGALRASLVTWVLCGLAYPLALTGMAQWLLPSQANGSLETDPDGRIVGSRLIGQNWNGPQWFQGRPAATTAADREDITKGVPAPYNAADSTGSNLGPTSSRLFERLVADRASLPADMLTASVSGLDPDISPANAALQAARVAQAHGVGTADIEALVARHVTRRLFGIFGEPRVNVQSLNLAMERVFPRR